MKRPIALYLVTCWLCLAMFFLVGRINRVAISYQQAGGAFASLVPLFSIVTLALVVWFVWAFIRLRPLARWMCVCLFAYWGISATLGITRLLLREDYPRPISTRGIVVLAVVWLAVVVPSIASIVYLFGSRCRAFALWYVQERRREEMLRYAQKQIEKGLRT